MSGASISASDWLKGITLSILASLIGASSKLAIRKSWIIQKNLERQNAEEDLVSPLSIDAAEIHEDEEEPQDTNQDTNKICPSHLTMRVSGMIGMSVLNPLCCVMAMNYASPSILAPFSGLTLVWVIIFSEMVLSEKPSKSQVIACTLIVLGEVLVATFGDHTNDDGKTVDDVRESYKSMSTMIYFIALAIYLALLGYWIKYSESPLIRRFAWGSIGGTITGPQNFLKDSLTVLKATDGHGVPLILPLLIILAAASSFVGLLFLTACMKRYDATYSAAAFVGSFVISASFNAAAHYNTFEALGSLMSEILYPIGLFVLIGGVYILQHETKNFYGSDILSFLIDDNISEEEDENPNNEETSFRATLRAVD